MDPTILQITFSTELGILFGWALSEWNKFLTECRLMVLAFGQILVGIRHD